MLDGEAVLLQNTRNVGRGLDLLLPEFGEGEDLVDHDLGELGALEHAFLDAGHQGREFMVGEVLRGREDRGSGEKGDQRGCQRSSTHCTH